MAAGKGSRLGLPKIYAKYNGEYFLDILTEQYLYAGISEISVVTFPNREEHKYSFNSNLKWLENPDHDISMTYSLYFGIQNTPSADCYVICPIDHPFVKGVTISKMVEVFNTAQADVVKPRINGKSGHPVIVSNDVASKIPDSDYDGGLNKLISDNKFKINYVDVDDEGIIININTQDDLDKILKGGVK